MSHECIIFECMGLNLYTSVVLLPPHVVCAGETEKRNIFVLIVSVQTLSLIPPPCFTFESCYCFADGILFEDSVAKI